MFNISPKPVPSLFRHYSLLYSNCYAFLSLWGVEIIQPFFRSLGPFRQRLAAPSERKSRALHLQHSSFSCAQTLVSIALGDNQAG